MIFNNIIRNNIKKQIKIKTIIFISAIIFNQGLGYAQNKKIKIVPVAVNLAQICYALGLADNIIYVPSDLKWPQELTQKPKLTNDIAPSDIISEKPDLVLADKTETPPNKTAELIEAGINVKITSCDNIDEICKTITLIGSWTETSNQADNIVKQITTKINKLKKIIGDNRQKPKVLMIINTNPITIPKRGSLADELIHIAGGDNITSFANNSSKLDEILNVKPDIIIELLNDPSDENELAQVYKRWGRYKNIPAATAGKIKVIPYNEIIIANHKIADSAIIIASAIHPEKRDLILELIRHE